MYNVIPSNTVVHFAPGTYYVSNLTPRAGVKLLGAGKDITNLLWDGSQQFAMIVNWGGGDGIQVSDLTLNGQQDIWGTTPNAINIFDSNNVTIRNVRVTNFKSSTTAEGFPLSIFCGNSSITGALIEYCEVDHFVRGTPVDFPVGATLLGLGHGGGGDPNSTVSGTVQYNYIHDCPNVQAIAGGGTNSLYQGNLVIGTEKGWYHDTYRISGTQVLSNQFLNCTYFGIVASSNASGVEDPNNGCDGLVIGNNTITMDPTVTAPVAGILLGNTYVTNSQVYGNTVTKSTATYTQYGFSVTGPGSTAYNNQASQGFTNILPGN